MKENVVLTGLDRFGDGFWKRLKGYRLGLLANQASLDRRLRSARETIGEFLPGHIQALFGPQHGFEGTEQDNMIETPHAHDRRLGIPVYSLYSDAREPSPAMLEGIDVLIVDLQDVGCRVYTFASTLLACLRAAARHGKKVMVLDRPNPLGGSRVEGNLLQPELYSFVGPYRLPMRHGLTLGEMARLFNQVHGLGCDLEVVPMEGWNRDMLWRDTGLRWLMPSPNMPFPETADVYPGQVIWEGTNLSEGRGTCRPFEIFGAPFIDPQKILEALVADDTSGCCLQEYVFRPTFNKWESQTCRGFMIHVLDHRRYEPYRTALALLRTVIEIYRDRFAWKPPPYEYEYFRPPIDLILGDSRLRMDLEARIDLNILRERWSEDLATYLGWREPFLLYA